MREKLLNVLKSIALVIVLLIMIGYTKGTIKLFLILVTSGLGFNLPCTLLLAVSLLLVVCTLFIADLSITEILKTWRLFVYEKDKSIKNN